MEQERTGALNRAFDTYKGWPRWGRIGAPIAALILVAGIFGGGEDEEPAGAEVIETTTTAADEEVASPYEDLPAGLDEELIRDVVEVACDALSDDDTESAAEATFAEIESSIDELDYDAFADTTGALEDIAPRSCPEEVADHPGFLNALAALYVEPVVTTTTVEPTTTAPPTTVPPTTAAPTTTAPPPPPPTTAAPPPPPPEPAPAAPSAYYSNCTAARAAGAAPVYAGDPGYGTHLDRDRDGVGCE